MYFIRQQATSCTRAVVYMMHMQHHQLPVGYNILLILTTCMG